MKREKNLPSAKPALAWALALALLAWYPAHAEVIGSAKQGYAIDFPEGYALAEKSGADRYHLTHTLYPVEVQLALYPATQFTAAGAVAQFVAAQLGEPGESVGFAWRRRQAAVAQTSGARSGWTLAVELAEGKGWLALAAYTSPDRAEEMQTLILSTLDSVYTDDGSWFESGPLTAFAWPAETEISARWTNGETSLTVPFNAIDAEAAQSVIDREFRLLTAYLDTPLVYEAWKRYYRVIWRDSWSRLKRAAFILQNQLPNDPTELAKALLAWTQEFAYERNFDGADFTNLPEAFEKREGDCDSRAMLMVLLLNQMGVDAILMVSPEYSHALVAVDCPGEGARYAMGGKKYLIGDTTAKVALGLIAEDMADPAKWFAVSFPAFPQPPAQR